MIVLLKLCRLHQWAKNALVFVPLILAGLSSDPHAWIIASLGFIAMSLLASGTYVLNDVLDLDADRQHWSKRNRPLAAGHVSITQALIFAPVLITAGLALTAWLSAAALMVIGSYLALTLSYSLVLKKIPIVDVVVLAILFNLRIVFGIALLGTEASPWLLSFSMFLFLSLSIVKRYTEVTRLQRHGLSAIPGRGYDIKDASFLRNFGTASGIGAIIIMVLYVIEEAMQTGLYTAPVLLWALPVIIILWLARLWRLCARGEMKDDPIEFALTDWPSLAGLAALIASLAAATML